MKRHDGLIPLTHDHHHALVHAKALKRAAGESDDERLSAAGRFLDFYEHDTLLHFREEEEIVFPLVVDEAEAEPVLGRLMMEHLRIHALVRKLRRETTSGSPTPDTLSDIGSLLEQHVRFEEKTVFPLIERLAASALEGVELAERDRTEATKAPSSVDPS